MCIYVQKRVLRTYILCLQRKSWLGARHIGICVCDMCSKPFTQLALTRHSFEPASGFFSVSLSAFFFFFVRHCPKMRCAILTRFLFSQSKKKKKPHRRAHSFWGLSIMMIIEHRKQIHSLPHFTLFPLSTLSCNMPLCHLFLQFSFRFRFQFQFHCVFNVVVFIRLVLQLCVMLISNCRVYTDVHNSPLPIYVFHKHSIKCCS